jgi:hypothetical protein
LINTAQLLKHIIPIEVLMNLPLSFVHRLRDLRIEQLKVQNQEEEAAARSNKISFDADTLNDILEEGM